MDFAANGDVAAATAGFVLCVCRQLEKKGTDTLLRAFVLVTNASISHEGDEVLPQLTRVR